MSEKSRFIPCTTKSPGITLLQRTKTFFSSSPEAVHRERRGPRSAGVRREKLGASPPPSGSIHRHQEPVSVQLNDHNTIQIQALSPDDHRPAVQVALVDHDRVPHRLGKDDAVAVNQVLVRKDLVFDVGEPPFQDGVTVRGGDDELADVLHGIRHIRRDLAIGDLDDGVDGNLLEHHAPLHQGEDGAVDNASVWEGHKLATSRGGIDVMACRRRCRLRLGLRPCPCPPIALT